MWTHCASWSDWCKRAMLRSSERHHDYFLFNCAYVIHKAHAVACKWTTSKVLLNILPDNNYWTCLEPCRREGESSRQSLPQGIRLIAALPLVERSSYKCNAAGKAEEIKCKLCIWRVYKWAALTDTDEWLPVSSLIKMTVGPQSGHFHWQSIWFIFSCTLCVAWQFCYLQCKWACVLCCISKGCSVGQITWLLQNDFCFWWVWVSFSNGWCTNQALLCAPALLVLLCIVDEWMWFIRRARASPTSDPMLCWI